MSSKEETQPEEAFEQQMKPLQDTKSLLDTQLAEEESEPLEVQYPPQVKPHDKLFLVLAGPEKCGKTSVANYLAQEH